MVLSYLLVAFPLVTLTPQSRGSNGSTLTCDATQIQADSYRLTTEAQALNLTRPRTNWWDAFEVTLSPYRDALADINEGAWRSLNERSKSTIATCLLTRRSRGSSSWLAKTVIGPDARSRTYSVPPAPSSGRQRCTTLMRTITF